MTASTHKVQVALLCATITFSATVWAQNDSSDQAGAAPLCQPR